MSCFIPASPGLGNQLLCVRPDQTVASMQIAVPCRHYKPLRTSYVSVSVQSSGSLVWRKLAHGTTGVPRFGRGGNPQWTTGLQWTTQEAMICAECTSRATHRRTYTKQQSYKSIAKPPQYAPQYRSRRGLCLAPSAACRSGVLSSLRPQSNKNTRALAIVAAAPGGIFSASKLARVGRASTSNVNMTEEPIHC